MGEYPYDDDHSAHKKYRINVEKGAVFVLGADGWVGTVPKLG